jgi:creatinine amidohydrolase
MHKEGYDILSARMQRIPGLLTTQAKSAMPALSRAKESARCFITSGVGSSEAHARFLTFLLSAQYGLSSRFVPLSSLAGAPKDAKHNVLIIFSQGLSPNARLPLTHVDSWQRVVLCTAATEEGARKTGQDDKLVTLTALREAGIDIIHFPEEHECTTLMRVIGPMAGYLCALQIADALAGKLKRQGAEQITEDVLAINSALNSAQYRLNEALTTSGRDIGSLLENISILSLGEYSGLLANLQYKFLEGMFTPLPPVWDLLHFAHGPFQQMYEKPATLFAITHADSEIERELLLRLKQMVVPERHIIVQLQSVLPSPLSIFDHEAMLNELTLKVIEARKIDQVRWPGKGLDAPLYNLTTLPGYKPRENLKITRAPSINALEKLTWPELETLISKGVRTAVIPLGAMEQHGPHLAFATDTLIASAIGERFCSRTKDSILLPTVLIGCSSEHMGFPGTLSLRSQTLIAILEDLLLSCKAHGFERAFIFTAHGGNYGALKENISFLNAAFAPCELIVHTDFENLCSVFQTSSASYGVCAEHSGHHAGEFETSILLDIAPKAVRPNRLEAGFVKPVLDASALFYPDLRKNAPSGTVGDPASAARERAESYLDKWVDALLASARFRQK